MSVRLEEAQTQLLEAQARHEDLLQEIEDYKQQVSYNRSCEQQLLIDVVVNYVHM